jgi:hypothetical protein
VLEAVVVVVVVVQKSQKPLPGTSKPLPSVWQYCNIMAGITNFVPPTADKFHG